MALVGSTAIEDKLQDGVPKTIADMGRAEYYPVTDDMVVDAFQILSKREGIIAALESAHAIAWVIENAKELAGKNVLVNLSGRGYKDVAQVRERLGE